VSGQHDLEFLGGRNVVRMDRGELLWLEGPRRVWGRMMTYTSMSLNFWVWSYRRSLAAEYAGVSCLAHLKLARQWSLEALGALLA